MRFLSTVAQKISIHAPCTGSDAIVWNSCVPMTISIHAPCTGSDLERHLQQSDVANFNPRSLHGERHAAAVADGKDKPFQSTLPARGATLDKTAVGGVEAISIHAPCTGSDPVQLYGFFLYSLNFNPRSLHGERRSATICAKPHCISIHAPCTGSDETSMPAPSYMSAFQSTLPARGATGSFCQSCHVIFVFQSTLPARGATMRDVRRR